MTDPRFIPASERSSWEAHLAFVDRNKKRGHESDYVTTNGVRVAHLLDHAVAMDEKLVAADRRIAELEAELVDYKAGLSATEGFLANSKAREQSVMSELVGARSLVDELAEFLDRQELVIVDGEYAAEIGVEFDALLAKVEAYKNQTTTKEQQ